MRFRRLSDATKGPSLKPHGKQLAKTSQKSMGGTLPRHGARTIWLRQLTQKEQHGGRR